MAPISASAAMISGSLSSHAVANMLQANAASSQQVAPMQPLVEDIGSLERAARQLQEDLGTILNGLEDLRHRIQPAEETAGDGQSDKMRKEIADILRRQTMTLEDVSQTVQDFPRHWSRCELNTSQRKALMLNMKARRKKDMAIQQQDQSLTR